MKNFLKQFGEAVPVWLLNYKKGEKINLREVLNSRVVYYPGAGLEDGQPVHTFVHSRAAHVFMYVDYMLSREEIMEELSSRGFKGYHMVDSVDIPESELTPHHWSPHVHPTREQCEMMRRFASAESYAFLAIFERDAEFDEEHGASRFAILFIGGDGIATYDAIFCNKYAAPPFCVVLQDHGFGGNWDCFGEGGLLEKAAKNADVFPQYILATTVDSTRVWKNYAKVADAPAVLGGMYRVRRELFCRQISR